MRLVAEPISPGSFAVRIWLNEPDGEGDPGGDIDTMCIIERLNENECEVVLTMGHLNDKANIMIGLKALELGYKVLHFHRSAGGSASHWADYVKTVNGMDYYTVDLIKAVEKL